MHNNKPAKNWIGWSSKLQENNEKKQQQQNKSDAQERFHA